MAKLEQSNHAKEAPIFIVQKDTTNTFGELIKYMHYITVQ